MHIEDNVMTILGKRNGDLTKNHAKCCVLAIPRGLS